MILGLLLAAGGARRFGSQKLVAPLGGVPLVRRALDSLEQATDGVIVVVGSEAAAVTEALGPTDATIVVNPEWESGMSTSIRRGVLAAPPTAEALVVTLGDEPLVHPGVSRAIVEAWRETKRPIVAARYSGEQVHPVLFDRSVFGELTTLEGDVGAKGVINRAPERVVFIDVPASPTPDVDQPADLRRLEESRGDIRLGGA